MLEQTIRKIVPSYGYTTPTVQEIHAELAATKYTPDVSKLEEYTDQLLFVCDELKKDHSQHVRLGSDSAYKCPAFTQRSMQFWMPPEPWTSPIPMDTGPSANVSGFAPSAKIKGQVWRVSPQSIILLDTYKQNTVEFIRRRIHFVVPYRMVVWLKDHNLDPDFGVAEEFHRSEYAGSSIKHTRERVAIIRAWMYVGNPAFWDKLISAYDYSPVELFQSKNRQWCDKYYHIRRPNLPVK